MIPSPKELIPQEDKIRKPNSKSSMHQGLLNSRKGRKCTVGSRGLLLSQDSQLPTTESNSNFSRKEIY